MQFTKIKAPIYSVNGQSLNEYELRQLQVDIKEGKFSSMTVIDEKGNTCTIQSDGKFNKIPFGFSLTYELVKQLL